MASEPTSPASELTGGRQTMSTWARVIESYPELPLKFRESCRDVLQNCHPFPLVVFLPAIKTARFPATEKILCVLGNIVYIWEADTGQILSQRYPLKDICLLEVGSVLLNSWMVVNGRTSEGSLQSTAIPFNTATLRHIQPIIQKIRPSSAEGNETDWRKEQAKFDELSTASFKFMNFARESVLHGEKILKTVWQPAIRQHTYTILGHSFDRITTLAHLAILTDSELILIRDDEHSAEKKRVRYGGVWQYIPLQHITGIALSEPVNNQLTLALTLSFNDQPLEVVFESSNQPALEQFRVLLDHRISNIKQLLQK